MERSNSSFYYLFVASDAAHVPGRTSPKTSCLRLQQVKNNRQTTDIAIQPPRSPQTVEAAVQTDIPDIMEELRDQVKSLTKIVAELTEMKAREKVPSLPVLSDSVLTFINQDNDNIVEETPPQAPPAAITSPIVVPEPQVHQPLPATLSLPTYPPPQMRSPLSTIDRNLPILCSIPSFGPSDQQKQKVEAIVVVGKEMVSSAMACIDILFSDEELANSKMSGSNGYRELDNLKLRFLMSVLRQKYESPVFMKQWEDVKLKINTRCRGKRRTVQRRLQKQVNFLNSIFICNSFFFCNLLGEISGRSISFAKVDYGYSSFCN